jgi:F-type H+-transporting ATPase subunit c
MAKICGGCQIKQYHTKQHMTGNIAIAGAALGATVALGLIGLKACEAVGRNPGASGKVLVQSLLISALAEGALIITILLGK